MPTITEFCAICKCKLDGSEKTDCGLCDDCAVIQGVLPEE